MDDAGKKINWATDFGINELLHQRSQLLAGAYTRMSINYPNHRDSKFWDEQGLLWARYERAIKDLVFNTQEEGNKEIERLSAELKKVLAIEKSFINQKSA